MRPTTTWRASGMFGVAGEHATTTFASSTFALSANLRDDLIIFGTWNLSCPAMPRESAGYTCLAVQNGWFPLHSVAGSCDIHYARIKRFFRKLEHLGYQLHMLLIISDI